MNIQYLYTCQSHTLENRPTKITDFSKPQYEVVKSGEKVAILGLGAMLRKLKMSQKNLKNQDLIQRL